MSNRCRHDDDNLSARAAVLSIQSDLVVSVARCRRSIFNDDLDFGNEILARRAVEVERPDLSESMSSKIVCWSFFNASGFREY